MPRGLWALDEKAAREGVALMRCIEQYGLDQAVYSEKLAVLMIRHAKELREFLAPFDLPPALAPVPTAVYLEAA